MAEQNPLRSIRCKRTTPKLAVGALMILVNQPADSATNNPQEKRCNSSQFGHKLEEMVQHHLAVGTVHLLFVLYTSARLSK
jgi:hypothetical protein